MATWFEVARENRQSANTLFQAGHYRSFVSRAYYAVYCRVSYELVSVPVQMPGNREGPAHNKLRALVEVHLRQLQPAKRTALSRLVGELYALRCAADYTPSVTVDQSVARLALGLMKSTFDIL